MEELIAKGIPLYCRAGIDSDLIYSVARKGNIRILKYLIEMSKVTYDKPQLSTEMTPLSIAAYSGNQECVKFLVESGARINHKSKQNMTPIYLAARKSEYAVVEYLCSINGVIEHMESSPENNAFHFAINNNDIKLVRIFLSYNASPSVPDIYGEVPLHISARKNYEDLVEILCVYLDNIDMESPNDFYTPFMIAVLKGFIGVADILFQMGANINANDYKGKSLTEIVLSEDNELAMNYLKERGIWDEKHTSITPNPLKFSQTKVQDSIYNVKISLDAEGKGKLIKEKRTIPPMRKLQTFDMVKGAYAKKKIEFMIPERAVNIYTHEESKDIIDFKVPQKIHENIQKKLEKKTTADYMKRKKEQEKFKEENWSSSSSSSELFSSECEYESKKQKLKKESKKP